MSSRAAGGIPGSTRPKLKKNADNTVSVLVESMGNVLSARWEWTRAVDFLRNTSWEKEMSQTYQGYALRVGNVYMALEE